MKNVLLVFVALSIMQVSFAQNKKEQLSVEQRAVLATKRLTLRLDLSQQQQKQMLQLQKQLINERQARKKQRKNQNGKVLSKTEKYNRQIKNLDYKIAVKKKFKTILTPEQYEKWQVYQAKKAKHKTKKRLQK